MLLAVVAALVAPLPARAYKLQTTQSGAHVRWYTADVALQLAPELEQHFSDLPLAELLNRAMDAWGGFAGAPRLYIAPGIPGPIGFDEDERSNGVYLVRDWRSFPDALAVTVATFESRTGKLVDTDVLLNANFSFALLPSAAATEASYDLLSVMTHELGHVLGLADTTDAREATMWPHVSPGETHQRDLEVDDEEAVAEAYGIWDLRAADGGGCGGASVLSRPAPTSHARQSEQAALLLALCLLLWLASRVFPAPGKARAGRGSEQAGKPARGPRMIVFGAAFLFGGLFAPAPGAQPPPSELAELSPDELVSQLGPAQRARFGAFLKGTERMIVGRAFASRTERRGGLLVTRFSVRGALRSVELEFAGGSLDGFTQVVSGRAPPQQGDLLVVAMKKQGPHGWAHLRDGRLSGGTLGASLDWP